MSMFTQEIKKAIGAWLKDNAKYESTAKLHKYVMDHFLPGLNYSTLHDYVWDNFGKVYPHTKFIRLQIKETISELKALYKKAPPLSKQRVKMLLLLKEEDLTKFDLARSLNLSPGTIYIWKKIYEQQGINGLLAIPKDSRGV